MSRGLLVWLVTLAVLLTFAANCERRLRPSTSCLMTGCSVQQVCVPDGSLDPREPPVKYVCRER